MADKKEPRFNSVSARLTVRLKKFLEDDIPRGYAKEKIESLLEHFDKEGFLTKGQWSFAASLMAGYSEYEKDKKLMAELASMFEAGQLPDKSIDFVASITHQFEEKHSLTKDQREQAEHIRHRNSRTVIVEE
jgi:hypothetical protein